MLVQNTIDILRGLALQTITGEFSPDWSWRSWGLVPQTGLAGLACCPHLKRKNLFIILSHIIYHFIVTLCMTQSLKCLYFFLLCLPTSLLVNQTRHECLHKTNICGQGSLGLM